MTDPTTEFEAVHALHGAASLHNEGGQPVVLLPDFGFLVGETRRRMTLLLHPAAHSGYATRLFFTEKILGTAQNWTNDNWREFTVLARKWWAPSWKDVVADQPWTSMLGAHLRSVR